jgi:hypothetical protein
LCSISGRISDGDVGDNLLHFSELLGEELIDPCANCFEEGFLFLGARKSAELMGENFAMGNSQISILWAVLSSQSEN